MDHFRSTGLPCIGKKRISNYRLPRKFLLATLLIVLVGGQFVHPAQQVSANVAAGFSEYYVPGASEDLYNILYDLSAFTDTQFTNILTMPITANNLTIYYDHWENGYLSGPAGDEVYTGLSVGQIVTFKSTTIPIPTRGTNLNACSGSTNPKGTTTACYDGMDRIYVVGGAVSVSQVYWPTTIGTVYANAQEVMPVKPWEANYVIPVGEDLYESNPTSYADFDCVYVIVEAMENDTHVSFDNKRTSAPASGACGASWWQDASVTLNKGKTAFRGGIYSGSTINADKRLQVQMLVGREGSTYDSRSHTLFPTSEWDKEYFSPVPSYGSTTNPPSTTNPSTQNNLRLQKSWVETSYTKVGDVLHYTYLVTNTGKTSRLGPMLITDDKVSSVYCPPVTSVGDGNNFLDRNESITCTGSYTVTSSDVEEGSVTNTATATIGGVSSALDSVTVYSPQVTVPVNLYIHNPNSSVLSVTYEDKSGTVTCNVPANGTKSTRDCAGRFVAAGSAAHLKADQNFYAIGEYDSGSSSRNWGFSLNPKRALGTEYFVPWAPGNSDVPVTGTNGSPVYVTPTVEGQEFFVDYSPITVPATADTSFTMNLLEIKKINDPDIDNTGMHIWSIYPFTLTWGEDAEYAGTGNPFIDAGYTVQPINPNWIDIVLKVDKSVNPEMITRQAGEEVEFTISVTTDENALNNIFIEDFLPPYFAYKSGSTVISWSGNSSTMEPGITGTPSAGYTLHWGVTPDNIGDLAANSIMTLKFKAITVSGFNAATSVNNASATGYWGSEPFSATAQATVTAGLPGRIVVIKDALPDNPQDFTFNLVNQANPNAPVTFVLDDDTDSTNSNTASFGLRPGVYSVAETSVAGWTQENALCTSSVAGRTPTPVNIPLLSGEIVTCTFTNRGAADLAISKTDGDVNMPIDTPFQYKITVSNTEFGIPAENVVVEDTLDPFLKYLSDDPENGYPYSIRIDDIVVPNICTWTEDAVVDGAGGTISCNLGTLNPGQTAVIEFWTNAVKDAPSTGSTETGTCVQGESDPVDICNLVAVSTDSRETNQGNNTDSEPKNIISPLAADLLTFTGSSVNGKVKLEWETANEVDTIGFNLYRSKSLDGVRTKINENLISSQNAGLSGGGYYMFKDKTVKGKKIYYYWLEEIDLSGKGTLFMPITVKVKPK
mgnify:CR=1 FL=1